MGGSAHGDARTLGRYVIYDEFASGGMASVHFGRLSGPVGFSRPVAIKRLHPHLARDPEFVGMFLDEARLAARVRHPNVVPTLDVVSLEGEVFIVMEYVLGESLAKLARAQRKRGGNVPLRYAVAAVASALHGLHAAHTATDEQGNPLGLVHRDVSPQNVLVGSDGVARMLDFGVAKAAGRISDTRDGALKGKVAYMPPEQLMSRDVSAQSDVYAASVVLWELLTGKRMFEGSTDAAVVAKILAQIVEHDLPRPSALEPSIPKALDDIVMRGLAPKIEERFSSAREMALLLEKNGGLVASSELGEWVDGLASEALAGRSARIRAIEASGSTRDMSEGLAPSQPLVPNPPSVRDVETIVGEAPSGTGVGLTVGATGGVPSAQPGKKEPRARRRARAARPRAPRGGGPRSTKRHVRGDSGGDRASAPRERACVGIPAHIGLRASVRFCVRIGIGGRFCVHLGVHLGLCDGSRILVLVCGYPDHEGAWQGGTPPPACSAQAEARRLRSALYVRCRRPQGLQAPLPQVISCDAVAR